MEQSLRQVAKLNKSINWLKDNLHDWKISIQIWLRITFNRRCIACYEENLKTDIERIRQMCDSCWTTMWDHPVIKAAMEQAKREILGEED